MFNVLGSQIPVLIIGSTYGSVLLGELALSQRLLLLPATLVGNAVGQEFLGRAANQFREGNISLIMRKAGLRLLVYGLAVSILVCLFIPPLIPIVMGRQWGGMSYIIFLLIPLFLGQIVVSPLSMAFLAAEKTKEELLAQTTFVLIRLIPLTFVAFSGYSFHTALLVFSASSLLGYIVYSIILFKSLRTKS